MEAELHLRLTGTRDMLQHNARLMDPFNAYTKALGAISGKRKKTAEELAEMAQIEVRGGMYETDDGYVGLPSDNVWRMIFDAAKSFKLGETVKRALHPNPDVSPILIDGKKCKADTYVSKGENRMFYHSVKIGKSRVMRARPRIPAGWVVEAKFVLLTDELEVHTLTPVLERAGRLIGVGDWRPKFGLCTVEVL